MFSRLAGLLGTREGACPAFVRTSKSGDGPLDESVHPVTKPDRDDLNRDLSTLHLGATSYPDRVANDRQVASSIDSSIVRTEPSSMTTCTQPGW